MTLFSLSICLFACISTPSNDGQRIVSLAPNLTEIVCALGSCEDLVGVTEYCTFPEQVKKLPRVGGYIDPDLETIVAMKPDLILALPEHQTTIAKLEKLKLRVETVKNWSIADIHRSVETVGDLIGRAEQANVLLDRLRTRQKKTHKARAVPPKCLLVLGHEVGGDVIREVYIVGKNGFLNEMIELAGGVNVYPTDKPYFPKLSQESLLRLNPDVVIELVPVSVLSETDRSTKAKAWQGLASLKAVRDNQYHIISGSHVLQAGPRYIETLEKIAAILDEL